MGWCQDQLLLVYLCFRLNVEDATMVKEKLQATRRPETTAKLIEVATYVGDRASRIVCCRLYKDGDAMRTVALIVHLLIIGVAVLVGSLFDSTLHVLLRHVLLLCRLDEDT